MSKSSEKKSPVKFSDYRQKIINAIKSKLSTSNILEEIVLIDGFINSPLLEEITAGFAIGGPTVPMVATVGKNSGRMYFFALKALISDIEI